VSGINTFEELLQITKKIGVSVSQQTRQFLAALDKGIVIEDKKELLVTEAGFFNIAPSGDLYRLAIFINQINARKNPTYLSRNDWHKFHLYPCQTIETYPISRKYRYKKTNNNQGLFQYIITYNNQEYREDQRIEGRKLNLCKNCHNKLPPTWRQCDVANFPLDKFYKHTGTDFGNTYEYDCDQIPKFYTRDWDKIAKGIKENKQWRCESCYLNLANDRHYLHAHHKDGDRANNAIANLKVLCIRCHAKQELHGHIRQRDEYKMFIQKYSERQN